MPKLVLSHICFFLVISSFWFANSARILDEVDPSNPTVIGTNPTNTLPSGQFPATTPATMAGGDDTDDDIDAAPPLPDTEDPATDNVAPAAEPVDDVATPTGVPPKPTGTTTSANPDQPALSFFMHDIIGGSHPSARVVAGIIANTDLSGIPFSKLNNNLFPITGGIPLVNPKISNMVNSNNLPSLVGLSAAQQSSTVIQSRGTNNVVGADDSQPFVSVGQLPSGFTIQKLMFGSITVVDDELTEGHELGSGVIGRAQGFYMASSLDGTSQTIVLTVLLHNHDHHDEVKDTISFFGVHRTASPESQIAVIGGTGKYENAKGYATVETLNHEEDQHTTDGVDTILHFNVYLSE